MLAETPVTGLVKQDGRISGVVVETDGEETEVAAGAVLVATGGFANNKEWIKRYCGYELGRNVIPIGNTAKMGDGIRMAWEAGAAEEGIACSSSSGSRPSRRTSPPGTTSRSRERSPTYG